mmetsp:Transcript_28811/g.69191  ORF Transcript_28811/g.69191 Transcript_28811/m.69191 type:complete len:386 (-) Transcript_28811:663-1820(-)
MLVVLPVEADGAAGELLLEQARERLHLLAVQAPEGVRDVHKVAAAGPLQLVQASVDLSHVHAGQGHEQDPDLVALPHARVGNLDGLVDLVSVARHTHHVHQGIPAVRNVRLGDPPHIHHRRQLQRSLVLPKHPLEVLRLAETPGPGSFQQPWGGEVAHIHVVHAGLDAGIVDGLDDFVREFPVVHQATVTDSVVHHLDHRLVSLKLLAVQLAVEVRNPGFIRRVLQAVRIPARRPGVVPVGLPGLHKLVVESQAVLALALRLPCHGVAGVLIAHTCDEVRQRHPPLHGLPQLVEVTLDHLEDRPDVVLGVTQEAQQVLRRGVARPAAQAHDGSVHHVGPFHDGVDAVGHPQLLVVVPVEPNLHVGERRDVPANQQADLFAIQTAK